MIKVGSTVKIKGDNHPLYTFKVVAVTKESPARVALGKSQDIHLQDAYLPNPCAPGIRPPVPEFKEVPDLTTQVFNSPIIVNPEEPEVANYTSERSQQVCDYINENTSLARTAWMEFKKNYREILGRVHNIDDLEEATLSQVGDTQVLSEAWDYQLNSEFDKAAEMLFPENPLPGAFAELTGNEPSELDVIPSAKKWLEENNA